LVERKDPADQQRASGAAAVSPEAAADHARWLCGSSGCSLR